MFPGKDYYVKAGYNLPILIFFWWGRRLFGSEKSLLFTINKIDHKRRDDDGGTI